jgi:hypothetical protein
VQQRARLGESGLRTTRENFQVIVSQGTQAHDFCVTVCFDGEIGFYAEDYIDLRRILRVDSQLIHAAHFGATRITDGRALLESAGKWKVRMKRLLAAAKDTRDGEDHADENRCSDYNEESHENLVTLPCHHVLFPLLALVTSGGLA